MNTHGIDKNLFTLEANTRCEKSLSQQEWDSLILSLITII